MKTKIVAISVMLASVCLMTSCQSKKTQEKKVASVSTESVDAVKSKDEIIKIVNSLPSNTETVNLINSTGAAYLAGFTGEDLKTEDLLTRADKAKTYGSIIFDLAYTNTYKQVESFSKLLKIYESLTKELGFEELVESQKLFRESYQNNKDNSVALDTLVANMLKNTNDLIQKNGSTKDVSLVFAGAVVKSLNVISYLTLFAPGKDKVMVVLQNQKGVVNATCEILEKSPADPDINKFSQVLLPINKIFQSSEAFTTQSIEEINKLTGTISK